MRSSLSSSCWSNHSSLSSSAAPSDIEADATSVSGDPAPTAGAGAAAAAADLRRIVSALEDGVDRPRTESASEDASIEPGVGEEDDDDGGENEEEEADADDLRRMTLASRAAAPPAGASADAGASGERAIRRPTSSARRSSGLSSMSSKKRGSGDGWATWVSSWAITSLTCTLGRAGRSRWITSPVVAATLPTERRARREASSVDSITRRPGVIASAIGRYRVGSGAGPRCRLSASALMKRSANASPDDGASIAGAAGGALDGRSRTPVAPDSVSEFVDSGRSARSARHSALRACAAGGLRADSRRTNPAARSAARRPSRASALSIVRDRAVRSVGEPAPPCRERSDDGMPPLVDTSVLSILAIDSVRPASMATSSAPGPGGTTDRRIVRSRIDAGAARTIGVMIGVVIDSETSVTVSPAVGTADPRSRPAGGRNGAGSGR